MDNSVDGRVLEWAATDSDLDSLREREDFPALAP
jgi:hypothetical protein